MPLPPVLLEDTTDTLQDYIPLEGNFGNVSSVEVRIKTPSTEMPDVGSEDSATLETTSYTLGAASKGATSIGWTATSGTAPVEGRKYMIGAASDETPFPQVVEVKTLDTSGTTIYLRDPLQAAVTAGDLLKGMTVSHALTAAETSDTGHGLAEWKLTRTSAYEGQTVIRWTEQFLVANRGFYHRLDEVGLLRAAPHVRRLIGGSDIDAAEAIEAAWENRLLPDLEARGVTKIWRIHSAWRLQTALAYAVAFDLVAGDNALDEVAFERAEKQYRDRLDVVLLSKNLWIDGTDEPVAPTDDDVPHFFGELIR